MANNYLQFSAMLQIGDDTKKEWLEEWLKLPDWAVSEDAAAIRRWCDEHGVDALGHAEHYPEFEWRFEQVNEHGILRWDLWIYAEEYGDPYQVALLVQAFFKKFKIDEFFTLTWAETCSKLRVDEFSGGGFIVMPRGRKVKMFMPYMFFEVEKKKLRPTKKRKPTKEKPKCPPNAKN